jgi:hypothetical protein
LTARQKQGIFGNYDKETTKKRQMPYVRQASKRQNRQKILQPAMQERMA